MKETNKPLLEELDYKPDFDILDRYINFSYEILRLSLLGISGFGALVLFNKEQTIKDMVTAAGIPLFTSVVFFGVAAAMALSHRFYATDSMSYHIAYLRKKEAAEKKGRNQRLKISALLLIAA